MSDRENLGPIVRATRETAALFAMEGRGVFEVRGEDRVRWLDGMISGNVEALEAAGEGAGCYATLLTNRGAVVADLHVGRFPDVFLVESQRENIPAVLETLERFIIADDVTLTDRSPTTQNWSLEGPSAAVVLGRAIGQGADLDLAPNHWLETQIEGCPVQIAAFGFSGERAFQVIATNEDAARVVDAIFAAGEGTGLMRGDAEALEILRVEAGIPLLGKELHDKVLPPEARLEHAISVNKGCYVGQEIVARIRARGQVNHLLVGLRVESGSAPAVGAELSAEGRKTGEITSIANSPALGTIALGYVRRVHAEPGSRVEFESGSAVVVELPFVSSASSPAPPVGSADPTSVAAADSSRPESS